MYFYSSLLAVAAELASRKIKFDYKIQTVDFNLNGIDVFATIRSEEICGIYERSNERTLIEGENEVVLDWLIKQIC